MSEKKIEVKQLVRYKGHSVSQNGLINLSVVAGYDELIKTINTLQMLNNDIMLSAKLVGSGEKAFKLGSFRLKQVTVNGDGESVLKFNGMAEYTEMDNINTLSLIQSDEKTFFLRMLAKVEIED